MVGASYAGPGFGVKRRAGSRAKRRRVPEELAAIAAVQSRFATIRIIAWNLT